VWIGHDVFVLDNISIGDGAIIAAKSVVVHDIPPYAVVAGNPAVVKKYRFSQDEISVLMETRWWEMPERFIKANLELFYSNDVQRLADRVRSARLAPYFSPE
jgi:virginiamycin A acetyltransferase